MARDIKTHARWVNGISDFIKEGQDDGYYLGKGVDHRADPRSLHLLPKAIKETGSIMEGLPVWGEVVGSDLYVYDRSGNIYKRTSAGVWSKLNTAPDSHGNGMAYFGEDDFIYYTTDKVIGRYGPISSTNPQFYNDFLGAQGGVPLNTNALYLVRASSQYAYRADTASLSITGDLSLETQALLKSLPASNEEYTLISKWDQNGNKRSYKFDITTESNYFGNGSDGALTISADTTDTPIDSACTGTVATTTLTATNASFAAGQVILIHQSQGTGAGTYQRNKIISYTAGTITLDQALNATYTTGAQVLVLKQYTNVTVNSGKTWTVKAWNGTTGGILAFLANGTVTVNGTITASGSDTTTVTGYNATVSGSTGGGFRGGNGYIYSSNPPGSTGQAGEGTTGAALVQNAANGNGGGGGTRNIGGSSGGGGGGNGTAGTVGGGNDATNGQGGGVSSNAELTTMTFGGGGGGPSYYSSSGGTVGGGASGAGIIFISSVNITVSGNIAANGGNGGVGTDIGQGGSGAGGSILIKCQTGTLGSGKITATGGNPINTTTGYGGYKGNGGDGVVHIDYSTSYTGTTSPTLNANLDTTLGAADGYVLRLKVSSNGTAETQFTKSVSLTTDSWNHYAVTFDSATTDDATKCQAEFFKDGVSLGYSRAATQTISDNTSEFFVGAYKNATVATGFFNGYLDEARVWNTTRTSDDYLSGISQQILTTTPYLQAYYKFNGDLSDATANANILTGSGTPTYVTNVPFPSPTTRLDIDQSATTTGNTYTTPTTISETTTARKTFTPQKDPQKSLAVLVAARGTGDWTITVHDQYNNTIATATIANANIAVGYNEFTWNTPWRPLINASYHFHITSTVADGTVTTTTAGDLETVSYRTYYQFLVTDTDFHPVARMLQFLVIGNERYVATYEASLYYPNKITLPAGYHVRCFAYYREYLAIGTTRGTSITQQDAGRIYFWDGIASTYNYYVDVPEGGINAMLGSKGRLWVLAGYQGDLLLYQGGDSADQIKRLPLIADDKYVVTYPDAIAMWRMLVRWGVSGESDSSELMKGVYTYGAQNVRYQESLSYDYPISTGSYLSSVKVGMLKVVDKKLFIGWQDNVAYGVDYIDFENTPQSTGEVQHMIVDNGGVWKQKEVMTIVAKFEPLNTGESVDIKYKIDREDNWHYLGPVTTAGETTARLVVMDNGQRYTELQYGVDLATTVSTSPKLLELTVESDLLQQEKRV